MICKDCRPVFYTQSELKQLPPFVEEGTRLPLREPTAILKHVELCPRHAGMEQEQSGLNAFLTSVQEEAAERRRYALLQAAAQNLPKLVGMSYQVGTVDQEGEVYNYELNQTVAVAEDLLSKIEELEKREPEKQG